MSEKFQCFITIRNTSGGTLSCTYSGLSYGKWVISPPAQILDGTTSAAFWAAGRSGSWTGTTGSVSYAFGDNATSFTVSFDVPFIGDNSGGLNMAGPGMSKYTVVQTESDFEKPANFPRSGDVVRVYLAIGRAKE